MITELRAKKNQMINQIEGGEREKDSQRKSINDLLDKHNTFEQKFTEHIEKQTTDQEDQFNKKLRERKDRSISRSLNKSQDGPKEGEKKEEGKKFKLYQNKANMFGAELDKDAGADKGGAFKPA